jgi:hypothetical protein
MPADYTIDAARQFVYSRGWGALTDEDLLDHQQRLALDPRFHSNYCQLIDFLGVTSVDPLFICREDMQCSRPEIRP